MSLISECFISTAWKTSGGCNLITTPNPTSPAMRDGANTNLRFPNIFTNNMVCQKARLRIVFQLYNTAD